MLLVEHMVRLPVIPVLLLGLCAAPRLAPGQTPRQQASLLLRQGNTLYDRGDFAAALERYRRAQVVFPSYKLEYNLGMTLQALGREVEAAEHLDQYLEHARGLAEPGIVAAAERRLNILKRTLSSIRVSCSLAGATVYLGGAPVGRTPLGAIYLRPGSYTLLVTGPDNTSYSRRLRLRAGQHRTLTASLEAVPASAPALEAGAALAGTRQARGGRQARVWTWVAAGGAAASLLGGIVCSALAKSGYDEYLTTPDPDRGAELQVSVPRRALAANVLFGVAGGLAVTSLVLYFVEGGSEPRRRTRLTVAPTLGPTPGLSLSAPF